MYKRFLSTILLVAVMLVARPAFAETNLSSIQALIQSLMAQVQELQRQLTILQGEAGGVYDVRGDITVTSPVANSQWKLGETMLISWKGQTPGVDTLSVHLISYKGGRTEVMTVASNVNVSTGALKWRIPEEVVLVGGIGSGYAIELRGKAFSTESGQFSIVKKSSDSVSVHIKNDVYNQSSDGRSAQIITSIGPSPDNSRVTSWGLKISCPSGVSVVIPPKNSSVLPKNICGTTQTYYTYNYPGINDGIVVLSAVATNKNDSDVVIGYTLVAYNAEGTSIGGDKDAVSLKGEEDVSEKINVLSPEEDDRYYVGDPIPLSFEVYSSDEKPDVAVKVYKRTGDKDLLMNEVYYLYEDGFVKNGKNSFDFYPAKGSAYSTSDFVGEFRLDVLVGEVFCCKWWIEPTDSDITGWFTISYDKSSATYDSALQQIASVLAGIKALLESI